jgi:hypothetical protein
MDWIVQESKQVYANTIHAESFHIFHDGLSAWWEKEAQEYLSTLGFKDRQLRCLGETNAGTRYEGKVVSDSPELCRALDSHGFADLKCQISFATSLTSLFSVNDDRRFKMGTPQRKLCQQ